MRQPYLRTAAAAAAAATSGPASRSFFSAFAQWTSRITQLSSSPQRFCCHSLHRHQSSQISRSNHYRPYTARATKHAHRGSSSPFHTSLPSPRLQPSSQAPRALRGNTNDDESDSLAEHTRKLLRRVPHSVVVVTTSHPSSSPTSFDDSESAAVAARETIENRFRAMTVSSLTSVTLHPTPIVSFNVKIPSATYSALRANNGQFLIHFLCGSPAGARIASTFTRGNANSIDLFKSLTLPSFVQSSGYGEEKSATEQQTRDGLKVFSGRDIAGGAPLLVGDGVMRVLRCKLLPEQSGELRVGDHVVLLAEVQGLLGTGAVNSGTLADAEEKKNKNKKKVVQPELGLCYVDRQYHALQRENPLPIPTLVRDMALDAVRVAQDKIAPKQKQQEQEVVKTLNLNLRRGDEVGAGK